METPIKVTRTIRMDNELELIKFQLITHCFVTNTQLNDTELNLLALLGKMGEIRLMEFCKLAAEQGVLGNPTAVNNCLAKIEKSKLFIKKGSGKKLVYLNPDIKIYSKGTVLLHYKIIKQDVLQKT